MLFSLIRCHLENGNRVWHPVNKTDSDHLEKAQRRATKIVPEIKDLPYQERLRKLKLPSLAFRRKRGDMIQVYKIMHNLEDIPEGAFFTRSEGTTRGNSLKLFKTRCRTKLRQNSFTVRVINDWNGLPESIVTAPTLNSFKSRIDRHWKDIQYD